jgi:serine/threonine-protein kinase
MDIPAKIGRYEILERVGRGGMGVLYRGRDPVLDREVAIKVMKADFQEDEAARPRFYREAKAAAKLQHRNIVTIFEFGEEDQTPYIVMEFLRGQDLARRLRADPPLTLEEKLDIAAELCTGLHFAHQQGVIHRDVKPGNIWLLPDGSVKLLDFGIATLQSSRLTQPGTTSFGSAAYMAPEHVLGQPIDGRADTFSAGVVLYEIVAGRRPFEAETPTAVLVRIAQDQPEPIDRIVPGLPPALTAAVNCALEKDPQRRFQQAGELATELRIIRATLTARPRTEAPTAHRATQIMPTVEAPVPASDLEVAADQGDQDLGSSIPIVSRPEPIDRRAGTERGPFIVAGATAFVLVSLFLGYLWFAHSDKRTDNRTGSQATSAAPAAPPAGTRLEAGRAERSDTPNRDITPADVDKAADRRRAGVVQPTTKEHAAPAVPVFHGVVSIHGSYPFEVLDGGQVLSASSPSHEVAVKGRRTLRVRSGEYLLDQAITVDPADPPLRDVQLPEPGYLTLRWAAEDCSARIGGTDLGFPPVNDRPIAAGTFLVRFTCPDGTEKQVTVTVRPGERKVESVRW